MKTIKLLFKSFYRKIIKTLFIILYGRVFVNDNRSNSYKILTLKNSNIKKFNKKNYKICSIEDGRICTDGVEQVAYISENKIIEKFSYTQVNGSLAPSGKNFVIKKGTPYFLKKYDGVVASLAQGASGDHNYFHWMFDILPKIKIITSFYNIKEINYFYMPKILNYQKKILEELGIKKIKFINSNKYKHIRASKIIIPDHPWYFKGKIYDNVAKLPKWIVFWLRSSFLKKSISTKKPIKLFIDRTESIYNHCKLINNEEMTTKLKKEGFKIIQVGKLSFKQQIKLFNNAKIIIGVHGAAFANLIFCKPKTKIIEIKPKNRPNNYKIISKINNLNYKQFVTEIVSNKSSNEGDTYINPKKVINEIYK